MVRREALVGEDLLLSSKSGCRIIVSTRQPRSAKGLKPSMAEWAQAIHQSGTEWKQKTKAEPLAGPVSVECCFWFPRKGVRARGDVPDVAPSAAQLAENALQALEGTVFFKAGQVGRLVAEKFFAFHPGYSFVVQALR